MSNQDNSNSMVATTWTGYVTPPAPPAEPANQSPSIALLAAALAAAQGEMEAASKDSSNPFFRSKYADLNSIWESVKGPLSKNGLALSQLTIMFNGLLYLKTILMHSSGEWLSGIYPINPAKQDPQGIGSAITYARRYSLSIVGARSTDDDGEAAMGRVKASDKPAAPTYSFAPTTPTVTPANPVTPSGKDSE